MARTCLVIVTQDDVVYPIFVNLGALAKRAFLHNMDQLCARLYGKRLAVPGQNDGRSVSHCRS